ncbi:lamin tail domain-containing protein [candidate division TA06 bacterium]|nr:lamin tail domain-containing protein [candidate division TA06 bacterium]
MKKNLFALLVLLAAVSVQAQSIIINEVQYDPIGAGVDTKTEWIELYNPTGDDIDLSGWRLCDNTDSIGEVFPSTVLAAGEYLVLAALVDSFHLDFPGVPAINWPDSSLCGALSNTADIVVIVNSSGTMVDRVNWGAGTWTQASYVKYGYWDPAVTDVAQGHSIGRSPNGIDTDLAADWADISVPTPGASNGGAIVYTPHTIYEIQNGGGLTDSSVTVVGIVTSPKLVDSPGFVIADAAGAWHGIIVSSNAAVSRGDSITINGTVQENFERTQINAALVTILGVGTIPAVTDVQLSDIKTSAVNAESYEGVLVRVPKALSTDTTWMTPTYGEWAVCLGVDTLRIDNSSTSNGIYYAKPVFGVDSVMVTGILNYTYSHFKLMPRDSADVINYGPNGVTGQPVITSLPLTFALKASPNPAGLSSRISFSLPTASVVELSIFNIAGQKVATLAQGSMTAGAHSVEWKAGNVPNGVYFYQLKAGGRPVSQKIVVLN